MRIVIDPKKPLHVRAKYNGGQIFDQVLQPGHHDIEFEHPKTCGLAEVFFVDAAGVETPAGSANYGACTCADASQCEKSED
jgi:hypothetical protein